MKPQCIKKQQQILSTVFACLFFMAAQVSAHFHSVDHIFHDADEYCLPLLSIEDNNPANIVTSIPFVAVLFNAVNEPLKLQVINLPERYHYPARAPPVIYSV